ncbi:MAG: hypothetical protein OEX03_06475, partial [Gammaproteobacteria bacterium]|nr:hypothetical protein [Gammaproteobacteria bacterium]
GVKALFALHEDKETPAATQVNLDAVINHMIGVQVLYSHFIKTDVPAQAQQMASQHGWHV